MAHRQQSLDLRRAVVGVRVGDEFCSGFEQLAEVGAFVDDEAAADTGGFEECRVVRVRFGDGLDVLLSA